MGWTIITSLFMDKFLFSLELIIIPPFHLVFFILNVKLFQLLISPLRTFRWYSTNFIFLKKYLLELSDLIWFRLVALQACYVVLILQYLFTNILGDSVHLSPGSGPLSCCLLFSGFTTLFWWNTSSSSCLSTWKKKLILDDWEYLFLPANLMDSLVEYKIGSRGIIFL